MSVQTDICTKQYELVKNSREVVFRFCEKFSEAEYTNNVKGFGRGSIANTQTHIANTYIFWIANNVMNKNLQYFEYDTMKSLDAIRKAFELVNKFMDEFTGQFQKHITQSYSVKIPDSEKSIPISGLQAFTHVITHEFHHKGQIMSMGRLLGYVPPDADIIRFS